MRGLVAWPTCIEWLAMTWKPDRTHRPPPPAPAGIDCVAEGIIAIRQMHGLANGSSDLFVVVGCRPVDESQVVVAQEAELVGAKWMPLEEYRNIEFMRRRALYAKLVDR